MTTLMPVLAPDAPDDPALLPGPPIGTTGRCRRCGRRLVFGETGWEHHRALPSWLCLAPAATLATPDLTAIEVPDIGAGRHRASGGTSA